jgi:sugar-specific transcriptional regulator TrmB
VTAEPPILETWIRAALEQAETLTPTELSERLGLPRPMIVEALIELAERGLIVDGSEDAADFTPDAPDEAGLASEP